jgi:hypothetical protein
VWKRFNKKKRGSKSVSSLILQNGWEKKWQQYHFAKSMTIHAFS